jgi:hypothetical protein
MATFGSSLKIDFNTDYLSNIVDLSDKYMKEVIRDTAFFLLGEFQENAPVDTGRLRTSFEITNRSDVIYNIYTNVVYAMIVNDTALNLTKRNYVEKSIGNTNNQIISTSERLFKKYFI